MILRYPDGIVGTALLLMRFSCVLTAFSTLAFSWPAYAGWWPAVLPAAVLILAVIAGFCTRTAAALLVLILGISLVIGHGEFTLLLLGAAGSACALILVGPGAYSVDARRFGRRVIRLEPRAPDQGNDD